MFTEKIEHIRKQCVPGLLSFWEGPGYEASGYRVYTYQAGNFYPGLGVAFQVAEKVGRSKYVTSFYRDC